jgi:hypothetical protein
MQSYHDMQVLEEQTIQWSKEIKIGKKNSQRNTAQKIKD